ncbi:predicted protein [Uncinocarpus reesii 1704]|uniref:Rhodopsin domain-containing protein n=1 Tax=Uncinocarpus reesii (strain UAMH 1704) TaxID=336963 RepID=C4JP51_UNCRE|nr:uncharacterized protein UREG_03110 [Uncinocarpus reesii 1704]EEP78265.1 predicted protein [Uncinocarpus reesii 1704]
MAGHEPRTDGDVNWGPVINSIVWVEFTIALLLVISRIFSRTKLNRFWGRDDVFMCLTMLNAASHSVLLSISVRHGTGRHEVYLTDNDRIQANRFNWISQGFGIMAANWGKVSVVLFLLRVVDRAKEQKKAFYGGAILLTIVNILCVYSYYHQCKPTAALWDNRIKGKCWPPEIQRDYAYFQGCLGCVTALGIAAMAATTARTVLLARLSVQNDYTFNSIALTIYIATEQYLIIIAACIPTLGPLVTALRERTSASSPNGSLTQRPNRPHGHHQHSRSKNRSHGGKLMLTGSDAQIYPLSEYQGWVGGSRSSSSGSDGANDSTENIVPGYITKTMEVRVNSFQELDESENDISLARGPSNEV